MSFKQAGPRRAILKSGLVLFAGCLALRPARSKPADDDYQQPKLDRARVKYQETPGPDGHYCGVCTNFTAPSTCRVVDGPVNPGGYCLSFAPKDIDF